MRYWQYGGGVRWTARATCLRRGVALTSAYTAECAAEEPVRGMVGGGHWGFSVCLGKGPSKPLGGYRPSIRTIRILCVRVNTISRQRDRRSR